MSFDIEGRVFIEVRDGYATVRIDQVDYDSDAFARSGSVQFTLWATPNPYYGGTIRGYRLLDFRPSNDTLPDGGYYSDVGFGGQVSAPDDRYYLTVTVQEYRNGRYLISDYATYSSPFHLDEDEPGRPIYGDAGNNDIEGTDAGERIYAGSGDDYVLAYAGDDRVYGGHGNDSISGGDGHDVIEGGSGRDLLSGQAGNDTLRGGLGNDNLGGNAGHDRLLGGDGRDMLFGDTGGRGAGRDTLIGGAGADTMQGDAGADRFVFLSRGEIASGSAGRDKINDFSRAEGDKIDLSQVDADATRAGNQDFSFIGSKGFTGRAGQLRFQDEGLRGDTDGDGRADFIITLTDVASLQRGDLIL